MWHRLEIGGVGVDYSRVAGCCRCVDKSEYGEWVRVELLSYIGQSTQVDHK